MTQTNDIVLTPENYEQVKQEAMEHNASKQGDPLYQLSVCQEKLSQIRIGSSDYTGASTLSQVNMVLRKLASSEPMKNLSLEFMEITSALYDTYVRFCAVAYDPKAEVTEAIAKECKEGLFLCVQKLSVLHGKVKRQLAATVA